MLLLSERWICFHSLPCCGCQYHQPSPAEMLQDCVLLARSLSVLWPHLTHSLQSPLEQPVRAESTDGPDCPCLASTRTFPQSAQNPGLHQPPGLSVPAPAPPHWGCLLLSCPVTGPALPALTHRLPSWPSLSLSQFPEEVTVPGTVAAPKATSWTGGMERAARPCLLLWVDPLWLLVPGPEGAASLALPYSGFF